MAEFPSDPAPAATRALAAVAGAERLSAAAAFHGVTGFVHHRLAAAGEIGRLPELAAEQAGAIDRHVRALGDLAGLAPALDAIGVPWLVIKGPVLAESYYPRPDLRSYNDLDVVVPGQHLGAVLDAVHEVGGRLLDRNWPRLRELGVGELLLRLRHGTLLDLHWRVLSQPELRHQTCASSGTFLERARPVVLGGVRAMTLDPVDTLVHLGAHGTLSGGHRLIWLKDVAQAAGDDAPSWDDAVARARELGIGPAVALALARTRRVLGLDVPRGVPEAMAGGRSYLAAAAVGDVLAPPARSQGHRSVAQLLSRAARADTAATMAEIRRRLTAAVAGPGRFSLIQPPPDMDPTSAGSPRFEGPLSVERADFLETVRRGEL